MNNLIIIAVRETDGDSVMQAVEMEKLEIAIFSNYSEFNG